MTDTTPNTTANKPYGSLRDRGLAATIWKRETEKGPFYTASLTRTYRDPQGNFRDSSSFGRDELLKIARLAQIAYDEILIAEGHDPEAEANADAGGDR